MFLAHRFFLLAIGIVIIGLLIPLFATLDYFWFIQFQKEPYQGSKQHSVFVSGFLLLGPLILVIISIRYAVEMDNQAFALRKPWIQWFKGVHWFMIVCCVLSIGLWLGMYNDVSNTETMIRYTKRYTAYLPYKMRAGWFAGLLLLSIARKYPLLSEIVLSPKLIWRVLANATAQQRSISMFKEIMARVSCTLMF